MILVDTLNLALEVSRACHEDLSVFDPNMELRTPADVQKVYCWLNLRYAHKIGCDILRISQVVDDSRFSNTILARTILEICFRIDGALWSADRALDIVYSNTKSEEKYLKHLWSLDPNPPPVAQEILDANQAELRKWEAISAPRAPIGTRDLFSTISTASLKDLYRIRYHETSQVAHGGYPILQLCSNDSTLSFDPVLSSASFLLIGLIRVAQLFGLSDRFAEQVRDLHLRLEQAHQLEVGD